MREFELVYIVSPEVLDEELPRVVEKVNGYIISRGGLVDRIDQWGRKRFAYPIDKYSEGNYILCRFKMDAVNMQQLEKNIKVTDGIIRHLLVTAPETKTKPREPEAVSNG